MPAVGSSKPAIIRIVVVLPQPDGPSSEKNSPSRDRQVDALDGRHGLAVRQVLLAHADELDRRVPIPAGRSTCRGARMVI